MLYRFEGEKIHTVALDVATADHCNLRCAGCSHMSPFLESRLQPEDELARDLNRLATLLHAGEIRFVGGEPLLHPRIVPLLKAARVSGIAERVVLFTNGLQLHTAPAELWEHVDVVRLNLYQNARPTEQLVRLARQRAALAGTEIVVTEYSSFRVTMVTDPHPRDAITNMIFRTCKNAHLHQCHLVRAGWLYKCSCPAYLSAYLARMGQSGYHAENDGFNIHGAADPRADLWNYLTRSEPLDACRHCLGYAGKSQDHHQLSIEQTRDPGSSPITRKTHLDRALLAKETLAWAGRRIAESLTGKARW
jgi:organic radical activating enzyme